MLSGTTFSAPPRTAYTSSSRSTPKSSSASASMSTSSSRSPTDRCAGFSDAHFGRPIVERADEVLGLAGARQPFASASATRYELSLDDLQRRRRAPSAPSGVERDRLAVAERHRARSRPGDRCARARGRRCRRARRCRRRPLRCAAQAERLRDRCTRRRCASRAAGARPSRRRWRDVTAPATTRYLNDCVTISSAEHEAAGRVARHLGGAPVVRRRQCRAQHCATTGARLPDQPRLDGRAACPP